MSNNNNIDKKNIFGFWIYIMSDCVLFATLFITYIVLKDTIQLSGTSLKEILSMPYVLVETLLLLFSSFTYGIVMILARDQKKRALLLFLAITFLLGSAFIYMEIKEFVHLIHQGYGWQENAAFSAFFTLIATHGLHVTIGLIWIILVAIQIQIHGITSQTNTKICCLGIFWHFLDIIWICVFTIVYLMSVI